MSNARVVLENVHILCVLFNSMKVGYIFRVLASFKGNSVLFNIIRLHFCNEIYVIK